MKYVYINCGNYVHMLLTKDTAIQTNQAFISGPFIVDDFSSST